VTPILILWISFCFIFAGLPSLYYLYMKHKASKPWNLKIDEQYQPSISILIPAHNEEKSIGLKLTNLCRVRYPREKMEAILVSDGSTDRTLDEAINFAKCNPDLALNVLGEKKRSGKSHVLNIALERATGEIIVVSDADCFWSPDILAKALPYLHNPEVGAITGLENLLLPTQSWVVETELAYNDIVHEIRLGESKTQSTIFFQGGFAAYKREHLGRFDEEADDSGTALNIVQQGARTLLIPEASYFTVFPGRWKGKILTKARPTHGISEVLISSRYDPCPALKRDVAANAFKSPAF